MTSSQKINRLQRLQTLAENNEKIQLAGWQSAKEALIEANERLHKLTTYFDQYAHDNTAIDAKLYANREMIMELVRSAISHQKGEMKKLQESEMTAFSILQEKTQTRKIHEKLTLKNQETLSVMERKQEALTLQELCTRLLQQQL